MLESTKTSVKPESFLPGPGSPLKPDFGLGGAVLPLGQSLPLHHPAILSLIVREWREA